MVEQPEITAMFEPESKLNVTLPAELRRQFAVVGRRLWQAETTVAVSLAAGALGVSVLAVFVSDRLWETPIWARTLIFAAGIGAAGVAAGRWASRWVWAKRDVRALARLVQVKYRKLGDRLLGIVELAGEDKHDANFSPELYQAAIRQVAEEASQYDFQQSVEMGGARRAATLAGGMAAVVVIVTLILPSAMGNAVERWGAPWALIPRYTLVTIEGLPERLTVAHGEAFEIAGVARYRSFWKPRRAVGEWAGEARTEGTVSDGRIRLAVAGQVEKGMLRVKVGDAEAVVAVEPEHRPALQDLEAVVQLPDYLHYTNQTESIQGGELTTVEGSSVTFRGRVSRPLATATMMVGEETNAALAVKGVNFASAATEPSGLAEIVFNWRDVLGLTNAAPLRVATMVEKDAAPTVDLPDLPHDMAMLESDALRIQVAASDDYGVRDIGLAWDVESDQPLAGSATTEVKAMTDAPNKKKADHVFRWSPRALQIAAGTVVDLEGFARDYYPQRARSRTTMHRLRVLSPEEHAEMVRQQLEATMAKLEDVERLQEKITANAEDVHAATNMPDAQVTARMGQTKDDQLQNAAQLKALSEQGEQAVEEAMKNPVFKANAIEQWNETMAKMQKMAQEQMQDAAKSMQSAAQNSKSREQDLADAQKKSEDILDKLQKMQAQSNEHMDDLQAMTLAQRLRKVGEQEKDIGGQLLGSATDTIGLMPQDLPSKYKRLEFNLAKDQGTSQTETTKLQNEIGRFFERTKKTNYGVVTQEMKDSHVADAMDQVSGLINQNIAMNASTSLAQWSERLAAWGDKLEPKEKPSNDSGSQGQGEQKKQKDLSKTLIALLRLREQQVNLRDDAGSLEQGKSEAKDYPDQVKKLSERQTKIGATLKQIDEDTKLPSIEPMFQEVGGDVGQAQGFLDKPETDKPSDDAQVKTIDGMTDLVNLINEQAQKSKSQQSPSESESAAEQMAFLMQAMKKSAASQGMAMKPATGLNSNGGTTSQAGNAMGGDVNGKTAGNRNVQKASGSAAGTPTEFRDAMDNYFHGIEQK